MSMASPLPTFYAQQMLGLHGRYGLTDNAKTLLRAYDDWKIGRIDQDELGRIVRMSTNMRAAITDTITKCAAAMRSRPAEIRNCVDIIQACTDILGLADRPPSVEGFPFLKLPAEVRRNVYEHLTPKSTSGIVATPKKSRCSCAAYTPPAFWPVRPLDMALAQASSKLRDEFFGFIYARYSFHFTCTCDLLYRLKANKFLRVTLNSVRVHWTGPESDKAFLVLAKCPTLKELDVIISKSTTSKLSKRETELRSWFTAQKPARITDALGMDELLLIRGLEAVTVTHLLARQGARRSDEDRASMLALLNAKLKLPREEGSSESDSDKDD
ncbi:hypothetical protein B0T26DRAFT_674441 [Lasiosphaeria miniovina]|uniref:F-box domain-containing protein n=1 Tax=Lasiosphaeria miniovina TaxID=1954250 RepID=A0AA40E529_9PEZI|nr:uncharacterized protein B0T26DRAFT_674441 [Lasiosphaeria miniovina]KAK0722778.1 hypothetical protein B0T26DRAFT_674441 [Lasiosphaeria miniovina]